MEAAVIPHIQAALEWDDVTFKAYFSHVDADDGRWCVYLTTSSNRPTILVVSPDGSSYYPTRHRMPVHKKVSERHPPQMNGTTHEPSQPWCPSVPL